MKAEFLSLLLLLNATVTWGDFFDITFDHEPSLQTMCESWRVNVEAGNLIGWKVIPSGCESFVRNYMLGGQYASDVNLMAQEAMSYASRVIREGSGKEAWVFDIDDTCLSSISHYSENRFGAVPFNKTAWVEWENLAAAPALAPVLSLYNQLVENQWSVFFLTGRGENRRNITEENLLRVGFLGWTGLIMRQEEEDALPAKVYKSVRRHELEEGGYRIRGNMGDQWSDLIGYASGERIFKVANPMYSIS